MTKPLVSVVTPVYEGKAFAEALDSVFAQDYEPFEAIVVDEPSLPPTGAARSRAPTPALRYIRQENQGQCAAYNVGIEAARGELVADPDDVQLAHRLSVQVEYLVEHPEVTLTLGRQRWITAPPNAVPDRVWGNFDGIPLAWMVPSGHRRDRRLRRPPPRRRGHRSARSPAGARSRFRRTAADRRAPAISRREHRCRTPRDADAREHDQGETRPSPAGRVSGIRKIPAAVRWVAVVVHRRARRAAGGSCGLGRASSPGSTCRPSRTGRIPASARLQDARDGRSRRAGSPSG